MDVIPHIEGIVYVQPEAEAKLERIRELGGFALAAFDNDDTLTTEGTGSWMAMCKALPEKSESGGPTQKDHKDLLRRFGDYEFIPEIHERWTEGAIGLHANNKTTQLSLERSARTTMVARHGTASLLQYNREQGIRNVIVSAGPEILVQEFARKNNMPIDETQGVKLKFDEAGVIRGLAQHPPLIPERKHQVLDPIIKKHKETLEVDNIGVLAVGDGIRDAHMTQKHREFTFFVRLNGFNSRKQTWEDYQHVTAAGGFDACIDLDTLQREDEMLVLQALEQAVSNRAT